MLLFPYPKNKMQFPIHKEDFVGGSAAPESTNVVPKQHGRLRRAQAMPAITRPPRVALIVETSTLFGRKLLSGVAQYLRETRPWSVHLTDRSVNDATPPWIESWKGDGIITRIASPEIRDAIKEKKIPVVDLNEQLGGMGVPQISNDHVAIGNMAADHLLARGFQRFAFLGHTGHRWSDCRREAFAQKVKTEGHPCSIYADRPLNVQGLKEGSWQTELDGIASWVASLEKPVGIMACGDFRGVQLLTACRQAGVAVPEQAAVVGVGADDVACQFADPPMSSVMLNAWQMGYEAATLLDRLMQGLAVPPSEILIPPLDVVVRRSSDVKAISDPLVARAVNFIQENVRNGINVETVLRYLNTSRTTLQNHFRSSLNRSIHDVLIEARLICVKELLVKTRLPIAEISERCGFQHSEYMSAALKKYTGWSPARYRQQYGEQDTL
jgi:LacI family transcriptional regulator